jgi:hypothetical protein
MPENDKLRQNLILEGLSSYLDAMVAIDEFTRAIQKDCRSILESQYPKLEKPTGLKFDAKAISAYAWPYSKARDNWDGRSASIGALLPVTNFEDRFHSVDLGLCWEYEKGQVSVRSYSSFYTKTISFLNELEARLHPISKRKFETDKVDYALVLYEETAINVPGDFQLKMEKVLNEWADVWQGVGTVAELFVQLPIQGRTSVRS